MAVRYEAWQDDNGITLTDEANVKDLKEKNLFFGEPKLLHVILADTPEEAMAVHHIKMGWEPFRPEGNAVLCPKGCGSMVYPKGSGQCPKCGNVF
jgi:hypothetical protein